ncbi:hypothetical protein BE20_00820 [Sorangium cellulosum]|uniref:Uncharacterized protein n=1 Tax=Sorangium cellulosum TaxID=56 RepID=A0A150RKR4_SORCE|nr:hypothetical protein BE18_18630 [Sorangium cellulosum]KYF94231.1 hypothetical protein BE20_00820 [Sorangium cellulosum]
MAMATLVNPLSLSAGLSMNSSALSRTVAPLSAALVPPARSTLPSRRRVAVWNARACSMVGDVLELAAPVTDTKPSDLALKISPEASALPR